MERNTPLIYVNNAATTWPKPEIVYETVDECFRNLASPDRTHSEEGERGAQLMNTSRAEVAEFFGIENPSRLAFVPSCTYALNLAIQGLNWSDGDEAMMSGLEHHAVSRPIRKVAREHHVKFHVLPYQINEPIDLNFAEEKLKAGKVRLVACTMASNVTGDILPVKELGQLAKRYGAVFLVDAAQSAGAIPVDVEELGADMLSFAGHKGLFGPPGIGGLFVREGIQLNTLCEGGTGKDSGAHDMSSSFPSSYEVGTHNLLGIVGVTAGVRWVKQAGIGAIRQHENRLAEHFIKHVRELPGVKIYGSDRPEQRTAVVSMTMEGVTPQDTAKWLSETHGVATRAGYHCAPLAHETIGTLPGPGTLRLSFGFSNSLEEVDTILEYLAEVPRGANIGS